MTNFIPRTYTQISDCEFEDGSNFSTPRLKDLKELQNVDALVLLGGPGTGKTTAFKQAVDSCDGIYMTVRDFVTLDIRPEWQDKILFIDGLDEFRNASKDGRTQLNQICRRLDRMGYPRFRLSCREADWFGAADRNSLKAMSRHGELMVLQLNPLTQQDVREFLRQSKIKNVNSFLKNARKIGIDDLLSNPQTLNMLTTAVKDGNEWPITRKQTFEMACRTLIEEHNRKNSVARAAPVQFSDLLNFAGRLCAIQLLTGSAGYSFFSSENELDYLDLKQISGEIPQSLLATLNTKLFETSVEYRIAPIHKHIAEFLAARHLASLIENGLPIQQVLALMTDRDGMIVSELRGLSAWVAAHNKSSRKEIVERDPLGTILYGDVREFSTDEKKFVLDCLEREASRNPWILTVFQINSRIGDLTTPDMENFFREHLANPVRKHSQQSFAIILIESLKYGRLFSELENLMMEVVRDDSWLPRVRRAALTTIIKQSEYEESATAELKSLLVDVHRGLVKDPDDQLLGALLKHLYPRKLSASEIWGYLKMPQDPSFFGDYGNFWHWQVQQKSKETQLAEFLDELVKQFEQLQPVFIDLSVQSSSFGNLPIRLLKRYLELTSKNIPANRLYSWLVAVSKYDCFTSAIEVKFIEQWLQSHPDELKGIIELDMQRCADSSDFFHCMNNSEIRAFHDGRPTDFGLWFLEQAMAANDHGKLNIAEYCIFLVADFVSRNFFEKDIVEQRISNHTHLLNEFTKRLLVNRKGQTQVRNFLEQDKKNFKQRLEDWHEYFKLQEVELREGLCDPIALHQLALIYFDLVIDVIGDTPSDRFRYLFGNDEELLEAILKGLRASIGRSDIPDVSEIIRLAVEDQHHYVTYSFLAGMEEIVRSAPEGDFPVNQKQIRQALAFLYVVPRSVASCWYERVLKSHCETAADVLLDLVRAKMRSGKSNFSSVYRLGESEEMARRIVLPLLESFPVRCTTSQLKDLAYLLNTALLQSEEKPLLELVHKKCTHRSMNVAQRVCWLTVGFLISPGTYQEELKDYVTAGRGDRIQSLEFLMFPQHKFPARLHSQLSVSNLDFLIRHLGPIHTPAGCNGRFVVNFINQLACYPTQSATEVLESLSSNNQLYCWHTRLTDALYQQKVLVREASFSYPKVREVLDTLINR